MLNKFIDLERLTTFFQGLKDIFLQKSEASTTYATKTEVSNKVDKVEGKGLSTNDYDNSAKTKVDAIPSNPKYTDTVYTHPVNHPPSIISQDADNRFVTDAEKSTWNSKASTDVATTTTNGLMSSADKTKLNGVEVGANNYTHPATHPPSTIAQDANNRFVSDTEKSTWNGKQNKLTAGTNVTISGNTISATDTTYGLATTSANGLMSSDHVIALNNKQDQLTAGENITISGTEISATGVATVERVSGDNYEVTKMGNIIFVKSLTSITSTMSYTLPLGFRPSTSIGAIASNKPNSSPATVRISISKEGVMKTVGSQSLDANYSFMFII